MSLAPANEQILLDQILRKPGSHLADPGKAGECISNIFAGYKIKIVSESLIHCKAKDSQGFTTNIHSVRMTLNLMLPFSP